MSEPTPHASDSIEQRNAEAIIIAAVSKTIDVPLAPALITIGDARVQIDGASTDRSVLVEAYARVGKLHGAQPKKLATDAFKLAWAGDKLGATRLIIAVADHHVEDYLTRRGAWLTAAIRDAGVDVLHVTLDDATRAALTAAQLRQYR